MLLKAFPHLILLVLPGVGVELGGGDAGGAVSGYARHNTSLLKTNQNQVYKDYILDYQIPETQTLLYYQF